ncbi:MAG: hypothetical protein K0A91_05010 [Sulfurimonas sp.]|nr:hypothetical protein [Sulfurimonas sp.]
MYINTDGYFEGDKNIDKYNKHHRFEEATEIIKKFKSPPAIDFQEDNEYIVPDFFVKVDDDISVIMNHSYYPDLIISDPFKSKNDELRHKLKEARDLVNLLDLRKSTLYFSLKSFFTNALSSNLSSSEIKNYIQNLIENENHDEPLTDQDLVDLVMKRYDMEMVRRTITKHRKLLNVPSSKERKKIYKVRD